MSKHDIPKERQGDVTYGRIVCVYRKGKKDKYCTRISMGENLINTVKVLLNSIISTPNTRFMSIDINDFYLKTSMVRYEYFCMKLELFPDDVILEYDLQNKVDANGNVHCEV